MEYRITSFSVKSEIESLSYWMIQNSFNSELKSRDEIETARIHKTMDEIFNQLDRLRVPFWVQNAVLSYGRNWRFAYTTDLYTFLADKGIILELH